MANYEVVLIFTPTLSEEEVNNEVTRHRNLLASFGAEIVHEDFWGLRQLAYPIKKKTTGIYLVTEYVGKDDVVARMEVLYKRDENIMRFLTTRLDKFAVDYNERKRNGQIGRNRKQQGNDNNDTASSNNQNPQR